MNTKTEVAVALLLAVVAAGCQSQTRSYDRAREIGLDYSDTFFDLSLMGQRTLGTNDTYLIRGTIHPIRKRVALGQRFTLARANAIYLEGVLSEEDKDHLLLNGAFRGQDNRGRPVEYDVHETIPLGIHGGILFFLDPKYRLACAHLNNDYLEIKKVDRKDVPNPASQGTLEDSRP